MSGYRRKKIIGLAAILSEYNDELVCDLAETYRIYDYHQFKGRYIATLVCGLRPFSRVALGLSSRQQPGDTSAHQAFATPDAFEAARLKLLQGSE